MTKPRIKTKVRETPRTDLPIDEKIIWNTVEQGAKCWVCGNLTHERGGFHANGMYTWLCRGPENDPHDPVIWDGPASA